MLVSNDLQDADEFVSVGHVEKGHIDGRTEFVFADR